MMKVTLNAVVDRSSKWLCARTSPNPAASRQNLRTTSPYEQCDAHMGHEASGHSYLPPDQTPTFHDPRFGLLPKFRRQKPSILPLPNPRAACPVSALQQ
jgi:hypothetical protein